MVAPSKLAGDVFGCYETAHTWARHCSVSWLDLGMAGVLQAAKIYFPLFLASRLLIRPKKFSGQTLAKVGQETAQSSLFLGSNCYFFLANFCIIRWMMPFVPLPVRIILASTVGSLMAIMIERESRRDALTVYMMNVASETIFNALRDRGKVPHIPHGQKILAMVVLASIMLLHKLGKNAGLLGHLTKGLLGTAEICSPPRSSAIAPSAGAKLLAYISRFLGRRTPPAAAPPEGRVCRHSGSCSGYVCSGVGESLLLGLALQSGITCGGALLRLISTGRRPRLPAPVKFCQLAACLGSVTGLFRLVNCILRRARGRDSPWYAVPAGMIASAGLRFYNSRSLTLYLFWKSVESWYGVGTDRGLLPHAPGAVPILYALSCGTVLSFAVMEPHQIRPSYWRFLNTLTNGHVSQMNWPLIGRECGTDTLKLEHLRNYKPTFRQCDVREVSLPLLQELGQLRGD